MFFSKPVVELPKITAPTAAEITANSKPSAEGQALLKPGMTPAEYQAALEKNKLPVDSVNFMAHGLPQNDAICWGCQSSRLVSGKLSGPEMSALQSVEAWLKNPTANLKSPISASLGGVDFTGPGSWVAQAAMWAGMPAMGAPGMPTVNLVAAAISGAIMLAAGLGIGPAMPAIPAMKMPIPMQPLTPQMLAQFQKPQIAMPSMSIDQPKMMKMLMPYIDLGKGVAKGTVKCC